MKSVRVVAIFGMLLHAGLIVWHNAAMLGSMRQHHALAAALDEICRGAGIGLVADSSEHSELPAPANDQGSCPICKGMVSAVAILSSPQLAPHRPDVAAARMEIVGETIRQRLTPVRPPTRGPPLVG